MIPGLENEKTPPRGSRDLGDGYMLLRATDTAARKIPDCDVAAVTVFFDSAGDPIPADIIDFKVIKWARLSLPTGQIARSAWKETQKPLEKSRMSRNVKVNNLITYEKMRY